MKRQGQAAIEFLTTYGWMFLVVLAVIGAMTYFGFGDLKSQVPSRCYLGNNLGCGAFMITSNGTMAFELTNFEQKPINISKLVVLFPSQSEPRTIVFSSSTIIPVGQMTVIYAEGPFEHKTFSGKESFTLQLIYKYAEEGSLDRISSGDILADIIDDQVILEGYKNQANDYKGVFTN
jgi:hypothetical protein